jgi:hypothetical protein
VEVDKTAVPLVSATVPRVVVPSLNVTLPAAVPVPGLVTATVAVKLTGWPTTEGLGDGVKVVVVDAGLTTTVNGDEVLAVKLVSPLYENVTV